MKIPSFGSEERYESYNTRPIRQREQKPNSVEKRTEPNCDLVEIRKRVNQACQIARNTGRSQTIVVRSPDGRNYSLKVTSDSIPKMVMANIESHFFLGE